ncbi:hypothetical protein P154DRAFT_65464 [Amniculicola lignicola CBS 123094]|uniref:Uncharacterized protein n=1 Tax=Amniculicola lignicola CBS 123094 TaxID=1392246 RepID=A0A6A5WQ93_9PLEO|nr:hypothetical protein P154DRAFT_65464 [Amniculicola lignicola CBS 123094]
MSPCRCVSAAQPAPAINMIHHDDADAAGRGPAADVSQRQPCDRRALPCIIPPLQVPSQLLDQADKVWRGSKLPIIDAARKHSASRCRAPWSLSKGTLQRTSLAQRAPEDNASKSRSLPPFQRHVDEPITPAHAFSITPEGDQFGAVPLSWPSPASVPLACPISVERPLQR